MTDQELAKELAKVISESECNSCVTEGCGGAANVKDCPHYTEGAQK